MKVIVAKVTSSGEQLNIEVHGNPKAEDFRTEVQAAFDLGDNRMIAMNKRIMDSNKLMVKLAKEFPDAYTAANQCLSVLLGDPRFDMPPDPETIKRDQAAQEVAKAKLTTEELAELAGIEAAGA